MLAFLTMFVVPAIIAVVLHWLLVRKQRAILGYILGLFPIITSWAMIVAWAIHSCNECMRSSPTCWCEWTGIGIFFTTLYTLASILVFSILALTITLQYKRLFRRTDGNRATLTFQAAIYGLLVTVICVSFTSLIGSGIAELWNGGFFLPWKKLPNPPGQVVGLVEVNISEIAVEVFPGKTFVAQLDQSDNCSQPYPASTYPICWSQSEFVRKIPEILACPNYIRFRVPSPPGEIVSDRSQFFCDENSTEQTNLVLLKDHSLWLWHRRITNQEATQTRALSIGCTGIIGFIIGAFIILRKRKLDLV